MASNESSLTPTHYWGLFALLLAAFLLANDYTAFSPALPAIQKTFNVDITTIHWVVNAYTLVYGVLIVSTGRMADIYGRRRMFITGIYIFTASSLVGGFAGNIGTLLFARAWMGLGGALAWVAILGMVFSLLPRDKAGLAGGLILTTTGLANASGPVIGGLLADFASWRWILFINIPIALLVILLCWSKYPPASTQRSNKKIDYWGVITLCGSLFSFLLAMDLVVQYGLSHFYVWGLLVLSIFLMIFFAVVETVDPNNALIPGELIKNRGFIAAGLSMFFVAIAFFATLVYIPQLFIKVKGFSAFGAGLALLPLMVSSGVVAYISGALYERLGAKILICAGALGMCVGLFLLSAVEPQASYIRFLPGLLIVGSSIGIYSPTIVTAAISVVGPSDSSLAGSIIYMFKFVGGALGLGVNATLLAMAPNIAVGIERAFVVDAFLALLGFLISMIFFSGLSTKTIR
ncbi:MFS transporter [Microbulbifer sp. TRSA002]|uniref:MFS transporter n=1 Tax=Microbulbifer sp. TRSA002 TaxID=3243382 RepID=UPI004039AA8D